MTEAKKLTKRVVDALHAHPGGRDVTHFDSEIRGFGVRVKASGTKSYVLKYRNKFGQQRKFQIARVGDITPEKARLMATKLRGRIADGHDPAADKNADRNAMTVAELCDEYLKAEMGRIKASTLAVDKSRIERHVKPLLGTRPVVSLAPRDMEKFLRDVEAGKSAPKETAAGKRARGGKATGGPGVASRTLGMLGTILQRAMRDGIIERNPARGIKRPKDEPYKPPFSFEVLRRVGDAMHAMEGEGENAVGLRAIRFLLMSGCRRMECLTLKWEVVDHLARCLRFADTKSGGQIRPIGRDALAIVGQRPEAARPTDYVFVGSGKAGHFVGLPRVWERVAKRAKVENVTVHGLRHWFASAATEMNYSELTIAGLLGHKVKGVTARYATAPDNALLAAADAVSRRITDCLDGTAQPDAKVIPMRVREASA